MKKIVFFGNGAQMNYVITKFLRKKSNIEVDLLLQDYNHPFLDHPAWDDIPIKIPQKIMKSNIIEAKKIFDQAININKWKMPSWVIEKPINYSFLDKLITKYFDKQYYIKKQIRYYVNDLKNYDFVFTDCVGAISALLAKKPFAIRPFGSDIDIHAFENNYRGKMIRKALKNTTAIFAHAYTDNLRTLRINAKRYETSVIIDTETFKPNNSSKNPIPDFFLASRLDFKEKGTDKLLRLFAKLIKSYDAKLFCLDYGSDVKQTHDLVNYLGIEKNVIFYNFVASKPVLNELFNKHTAVIGNLNYGTIGTTELEALACNKPVISFVKPKTEIEKKLPILNSRSEDEIYENLKNIIEKRNLPSGMREFIKKNFGYESFLNGFKDCIN
ncbi:glycosyltransferase [Candidatus Nitrosotenuis uzonensis]|uniref:Glycosyl transferase family 1 domain-containing protein n=1 Tax=Candidatus Nitrosotenuis uzonensis TaxID=1407055 RepID=V6AVE3_9ARCH|nr:glycosyltransferase [Candidatus Nitrosotenuis uzonensis]CDI06473.1 hypothetical protein NITUZ_50020 [Candidatus Nitrosotenuis uzonensis]